MTKRAKVGLIGTEKIGWRHAERFAFCIPEAELVAVSDIFLETVKKFTADDLISTVYNDHHPILADNVFKTHPLCLITNTHAQLITEPDSTNSFYFPPFCYREQEIAPAPAS